MSLPNFTRSAALILFGVCMQSAPGQNPSAPAPTTIPVRSETMVVLGSAAPVPLAESPRSVVVLPLKGKNAGRRNPTRFPAPGLVRLSRAARRRRSTVRHRPSRRQLRANARPAQRVPHQRQPDLAPQPRSPGPTRSDGLHPGSRRRRLHASRRRRALRRCRLPHRRARSRSLLLRAAEGSFESNEESLLAGATRGRWSGRATASRNFSTGFTADRDYRNEDASAENWLGSRLGITRPALRRERPLLRRQPVLRPVQFVGAHQRLVRLHAPGTGQPHRRGLRLPSPHRRIHSAARQAVRLREQPHRRFVAGVVAAHSSGCHPIAAALRS